MAAYKIGMGFNVAEEELELIVPQCRSNGIEIAKRIYTVGDTIVDQLPYIVLEWNVIEDGTMYSGILDQFGLDTVNIRAITIMIPGVDYVAVRYNGRAILPEPGRDIQRNNYYLRNLSILIRDLTLSV